MAAVQTFFTESREETRTESRSSGPNITSPKNNELDSLLSELNQTRYSSIQDRAASGNGLARPSVDSLLSELNSVSNSSNQQRTQQTNEITASTATRDLDDLMAELSDFKEDRSWVEVLENQVERKSDMEKSSVLKSSKSAKTKASSPSGKPPTTPPPVKKPMTPPPKARTPRNSGGDAPPRPPAPSDVSGAPMTLPYPDVPPPIPPPPASVGGVTQVTLTQSEAAVKEPFERPDSGGPVKRNDAAFRWVTDAVKYEITAPAEEEPPVIPLNKNDTYAKPEKPKSPSPPQVPLPPPKEPSPPVANELDCMLGTLANHMTEQGVTTTQKGCCCACDKPIVGQVITALGKTWHPEHFTCNNCSAELGSKNFFEREGKPYCETCYHELFSPKCAYCNKSILDKCVTALDKNWHPDHFFCAQCGNTFGEEGFHEKDGKAYCREDYYNMFAPKCGGCNSPIMENYISALNAQWHPECFVCRDCKKQVTGKSYYAMEGKPVCAACVGVSSDEGEEEEEEES